MRNAFYTSLFRINKKGLNLAFGSEVMLRACSVTQNGGGEYCCC